jgi:hypothetical protein
MTEPLTKPPADITPDSKDWTWVLREPCGACGLEASTIRSEQVGDELRAAAQALATALEQDGATRRPQPAVWSPLEYACHVRDVFRVFGGRLDRMLTEEDPLFANWDQDATAREDGYAAQDPQVVAQELLDASEVLAARFDALPAGVWERRGRRSDGAQFTVATLAQYLVHDPVHHVWDVTAARRA